MNTRYTAKTLCVVALLGSAAVVSAQEDAAKKKSDLNREMTLEREYDPSVGDANKVNTLPVIKEPEARKIPIDYSDYTLAADPDREISVLPAGQIMTAMDYDKRRGYLNFGMGTRMNIGGDLGYHILNTEKDRLSVHFSHRSTNGNVKYIQREDEKVKAKLNDNLGGIDFRHAFDKLTLNMGLKYGYSAFNYYGLPMDDGSGVVKKNADRETNQVHQTIAATIGFESKEGATIGYLLDLGYINFAPKYGWGKSYDGPKENTFDVKFDVSGAFNGNMRAGLGGQVEYFNYSIPMRKNPSGSESPLYSFENHAEIMLSPYYKVEGDTWNVKLGANVMLATGNDNQFMASPNVEADVEVADKTQLYLTAGGKLYSNSLYEISRINRYTNPTVEIAPSRNWLDALVGIKSGVAPGFWFDIFAGYKMTSSDVLFLPTRQFDDMNFGNFSEVMSDIDTKRLFAGVNLKYSYQELFEITLKGVYNNWKANYGDAWIGGEPNAELEHAWGKPEMEINAGLTVRPIDKLSLGLDYYLATGRYTELEGFKAYKMNNINELNFTGSYAFSKTFGFYVRLTNVLCQKYELYYGYPVQSFNAMAGVNINF